MAEVELIMPKMGESIMEATILKWLKNVGDPVAVDEPVLEIATDKVDSEVPSTHAGKLAKILYQVNDVVPVGKVIAILETDAAAAIKPVAVVPEMPKTAEVKSPVKTDSKPVSNEARFYSPLVLNIARSEGISMSVLDTIPGTGEASRGSIRLRR